MGHHRSQHRSAPCGYRAGEYGHWYVVAESRFSVCYGRGTGGVEIQARTTTPESDRKPSPKTGGSFVCVLFVVRGPGKDVCGGKVGEDDAKFCSLPCLDGRISCGRFAKHEKSKASLRFPAYYIGAAGKPGGGAFCHPVLLVPPTGFSTLAVSVVSDTTKSRTVADWREVFTVLSGFESLSVSEQRKVIERINTKIQMGPTPMKPRKLINLNDSSEELTDASDSWVTNLPNVYSALMIEESDNESPTDALAQIKSHWNDVIHALVVQRRNLEKMDSETAEVMEAMDNKLVKVISAIGSQMDIVPAPDIWSSVNANAVHLQSLARNQEEMSSELFGLSHHVDSTLDASSKVTEKQMSELTEQVASISFGVQGLTHELHQKVFPIVQDVIHRVSIMEGGSGSAPHEMVGRVEAMNKTLERLDQEVTGIKFSNRSGPSAFGSYTGGTNPMGISLSELEQTVTMLMTELGVLKDEVKTLKEENNKMKQDLNSECISFAGHSFPNKEAYILFIMAHDKKGYFGVCYDFISFMECQVDQNRTSDEAIKSLKTLTGAGYADLSSGRIDTSFSTLIPKIFGKEQDPKDPSKKMDKLTSMDVWDHPTSQSGVKADITSFISTYSNTARGQIETEFGVFSQASRFFNVLIDHIETFWNKLDTWITRFERELSAQCGGDDPAIHKAYIWKLICWMLHTMFKEFQKRRHPGTHHTVTSLEQTAEDKRIKAASILQGTMQAHGLMAELIKDDFVRHPMFASTMVEFLLKTKASNVSMMEVIKKQKALEVKVNGIQSSVDKVAAKRAGNNVGAGGGGGGGGGAVR